MCFYTILLGFARNFPIFLQIPILFRTFAVVLLWMAGDESLARQKSMAWPIIIKKDVYYVFF